MMDSKYLYYSTAKLGKKIVPDGGFIAIYPPDGSRYETLSEGEDIPLTQKGYKSVDWHGDRIYIPEMEYQVLFCSWMTPEQNEVLVRNYLTHNEHCNCISTLLPCERKELNECLGDDLFYGICIEHEVEISDYLNNEIDEFERDEKYPFRVNTKVNGVEQIIGIQKARQRRRDENKEKRAFLERISLEASARLLRIFGE